MENEVIDEVLENADEVVEGAGTDSGASEGTASENAGAGDSSTAAGEPEETVVTIGDETPQAEAIDNATIRQMRERMRELDRENKALKRATSPAVQALGKEPTLADFEYDEEKFKPALADYLRRQAAVEAEQERLKQQAIEQQNAFQSRLHSYEAQKAALKLPNIDDAESAIKDALSAEQQACIIKYAKTPALVIAALGANPGKLKEFAAKKDLGEFVYALADVEKLLKVTKKTNIPEPEQRMKGETTPTGTAEGALDRLRAEAEKTGDYTKVNAYKRQMKEKAA